VLRAHSRYNGDLARILNAAKTPRFLSLRFKSLVPALDQTYDFVAGGRWDFEIGCELEGSLKLRWKITPKVEFPDFKLRKEYFPDAYKERKP
jgi:hypothetical protein